jgi:hypothetical protein
MGDPPGDGTVKSVQLVPRRTLQTQKKQQMTLLIFLTHSDTNDGRGRRYSTYGRNTYFLDKKK